ncbi:MAG TPA: DUF4870 domain-containing protein [Pyrinomonadaceae bacterium]|jgi:uncharacterized membrane protein
MQNPPPNQPGYSGAPYGSPSGGGANEKSSTGLDANVAALLCYLLTWITGLIFYLIEKDSRYVRYHAMQAILLGAAFFVLGIAINIFLGIVAAISGLLATLLGLLWMVVCIGFIILWVLCLVKAYQGQTFKLPIIGDMAANIVNK